MFPVPVFFLFCETHAQLYQKKKQIELSSFYSKIGENNFEWRLLGVEVDKKSPFPLVGNFGKYSVIEGNLEVQTFREPLNKFVCHFACVSSALIGDIFGLFGV